MRIHNSSAVHLDEALDYASFVIESSNLTYEAVRALVCSSITDSTVLRSVLLFYVVTLVHMLLLRQHCTVLCMQGLHMQILHTELGGSMKIVVETPFAMISDFNQHHLTAQSFTFCFPLNI